MTGGRVVDTTDHSTSVSVRCRGLGDERGEDVTVYLERCNEARSISPGDALRWEGRFAFWTPKGAPFTDTIELANDALPDLIRDATEFLGARERYARLGIPHRRGYLFSGPPGNGKSSLALALAGALGAPLYVLSLGSSDMTDGMLLGLFGRIPSGSVVVVEDVDTIFVGREREADNKLTLSGLLNAIDGPLASEGRLLVMTTNHPEKLDPALVRPGRADRHIVLGNATPGQARAMWRRFHGEMGADEFAAWAGDGTHSMAALQAHLLGAEPPRALLSVTPAHPVALTVAA